MKIIIIGFISLCAFRAGAQSIRDIHVDLYTDSLKKGTYNYINIDGELTNGKFLPLDSTKIRFSCPQAKFYGNSLFIPADFKEEKVDIRAVLKSDETKVKEFTLYIKKAEDPPLRNINDVMNSSGRKRSNS